MDKRAEFETGAGGGNLQHQPPRVSDLVNGKISKFTIDALLTMLAKTGKTAELNIRA
ncbi:XRE family transcriptional regulator [Neisseria polysaccharea]|uniref:XRE family transcriptional regulator n=1 Tax=Neisseria polysaccharea TaxID=489 RepID=UPI0020146CA2